MKTEEILRYDRMYRAMREALGTPFLTFDFPDRSDQVASEVYKEGLAGTAKAPVAAPMVLSRPLRAEGAG